MRKAFSRSPFGASEDDRRVEELRQDEPVVADQRGVASGLAADLGVKAQTFGNIEAWITPLKLPSGDDLRRLTENGAPP